MTSFPPPPPEPPGDGPAWGPPETGGAGYDQLRYASWGARVGAYLLDALAALGIFVAGFVLGAILSTVSDDLGSLAVVAGYIGQIVFFFWNLVRQGRTGQTIGKQALGITLVRLARPGPPGLGLSIGRSFLHIVDALPCYLGFLWPLWDQRRQTFADKILETVVLAA